MPPGHGSQAEDCGVIDLANRKLFQTIAVGRARQGIFFLDRAPVTAPNGA